MLNHLLECPEVGSGRSFDQAFAIEFVDSEVLDDIQEILGREQSLDHQLLRV